MPIRNGIEISEEDAIEYDKLIAEAEYYDSIQYTYKIKLNATFGAISNQHFKFGDKSLGESITAGGRHIVTHQHRQVNKLLDGSYDEFGKGIIYGDSVAGNTVIHTSNGDIKIEDLFTNTSYKDKGKEYCNVSNIKSLTFNEERKSNEYRDIKYVVRHAVDKKMFRVWSSDTTFVDVTEDHSLMIFSDNKLVEAKPTSLQDAKLIIADGNYTRHVVPVRIEEIDSPEYVYDIEVDTTHTFYGNDILLHNTDSTYFNTFADSTEDAKAIGDAIAEEVNKSFIPYMMDNFLIDEERAKLIKSEREIVADRGIFIMKKKYMLHLTDLDGYPVDKVKNMGTDLKRTTIPKAISIKLESFIERLLKGEEWEDMEVEVVQYKDELIQSDNILDIGIPSGVNKVEAYTREYEKDPTTRLPGTVAPCIFYNICRDQNNDNASPAITSGMKTKKFFLATKQGRFKTISLPTDMTKYEIPAWFSELEIDLKTHMDRLVDAPINNVLKAIGKKAPTHQSLIDDSLFEY